MWIMAILNLDSIATTVEYIWTILAYNFILALNTLTWHRISQENDAFDKDNPETESNSKFSNNLSQDTLKGKGKSHINFENLSFSFLKKTKSKHPKNLFSGHANINSIRNKFESVQEITQNTFRTFFFSETKIDSSIPNQQFSISEYRLFQKIAMHIGEDYFFMLIKIYIVKCVIQYVRILRF